MLNVWKPSTVFLIFKEPVKTLTVRDSKGSIYYERIFKNATDRVFVNIPDKGKYSFNPLPVAFQRTPLKIFAKIPKVLPPPERDNYLRIKKIKIIIDDSMDNRGTPAKINSETGQIHVIPRWFDIPVYRRKFILFHEIGHLRYKTEEFCDLYAAVQMLKRGYNESSCIYSLTRILKKHPANLERIGFSLKSLGY